jgi:5-methylcytosine-specific restriction endonuclease McrA
MEQALYQEQLMSKEHDPFYDSKRWRKLRSQILQRDGYVCQLSKRRSLFPKPAEIVHHIFPRENFPEFEWEPWNLISLSRSMHNELHDRTTKELTDDGMDLLKRTARKRGMDMREIEKRLGST